MTDIKKLLDYLKLDTSLIQGKIKSITKKNNTYCFNIDLDNDIDTNTYELLNNKLKEVFDDCNTTCKLTNNNNLLEFYKYFINEYSKSDALIQMFLNVPVTYNNNELNIELDSVNKERTFKLIQNKLINDLDKVGIKINNINITVNTELSIKKQQEELNNLQQVATKLEEKINKSKEVKETKKYTKTLDENVIHGRKINTDIAKLCDIQEEMNDIAIEVEVFDIEGKIITSKDSGKEFKIINMKLTDYTDSIQATLFVNTKDEYDNLLSKIKKGKFYIMRGTFKHNIRTQELSFSPRDINISEKVKAKRIDSAKEKRVELHMHTMMSQMDGVISDEDVINRVADFGHNAVAITDHNGVQAFPHIFKSMNDINKKRQAPIKDKIKELEEKISTSDSYDKEQLTKELEEKKQELKNLEKFKVIFGTEIGLIDDDVNIVLRPNNKSFNQTYVVFDLETTGFNALAGDTIIEIGAVKVKIYQDESDVVKLEEIERYDKLINPLRKLPQKIIELTSITDEMLETAELESVVVKDFKEFVGDLPMVAHNARFDCSFLSAAYKNNDLGKFENPVLDTLELSRALDPNESKHNLTVLAKRYKIEWNEDEHHRGDYDAFNTSKIFVGMLNRVKDHDIKTLDQINNLIDKDQLFKTSRSYHVNILALNKEGLKNLFKIVSYANTTYYYREAKIPKSKLNELRKGLLIGSGCYESEVFSKARSKDDDEMSNIIDFYDYVEVQPPEVYSHLIDRGEIETSTELLNHIRRIIKLVKESNKIIVATGDVHHFNRDDKIYRQIIVNQKVGGTGRHPLNRPEITEIPSQHLRDTDEMLNNFNFLDQELAYEIVVTNTNKIKDMADIYEVIEYPEVPYSPNMDKPGYIIRDVVRNMVYEKASSIYGTPLPVNIEERIAEEFYGANIKSLVINKIKEDNPNITDEELTNILPDKLHEEIMLGYDEIYSLASKKVKKELTEEISDDKFNIKVKKTLGGVIGGGFDVIYYIAQQLVKKSNDDGYIVGSRGSVGSSFVATMMGITEVNPLPAHYICPNCKKSIFEIDGESLGTTYSSGFDLPEKNCPNCKEFMIREGQDMPFATFLGFNADKVPDIDLNFSGDYQWKAHEYTKVLFGVDNVYRAGTIGTVADKTAYGYVKGYCEDKNIQMRSTEIERIAKGCTGVKRTTGQHPGGIVVVPKYKDVFDFTPFQYPADDITSRWRTTHFDYHAIDADLLKLDILGHDDPTVLKMLQDMSGIDFRKIDLSDKETMAIFTGTDSLGIKPNQIMCPTGTLGIPEFGTKFTIGMLQDTKPTTFSELIKISGLSHGTDVWLGNARDLVTGEFKLSTEGIAKVPFKEVIGCRDDIMVYLMYHGLKPFKAFKIMEFVRKGKASKDPEGWKLFEKDMQEAGINQWFIDSCSKIKYMFPKAHAAAYVISAFRIAWFKVHKPVYYYCAYFSKRCESFDIATMIKGYDAIKKKIEELENKTDISNKESDILEVLRVALEASARGIIFKNFDIERSLGNDFVIDGNSLIPPFRAMDGLGGVVAQKIEEEREKKKFTSISDFKTRGKVPTKIVEELINIKSLKDLPESNQLSLF